MPIAYFDSTRESMKSLTDIFDFVWPTTAAMWNLRWQVDGLVRAQHAITEDELFGRFICGSGISRTNLKRACIEQPWEMQKQRFAEILLTATFSLYESWCERILESLKIGSAWAPKSLQFPTEFDGSGTAVKGLGRLLNRNLTRKSDFLCKSFYPAFSTQAKVDRTKLESWLICYRYFKEVRNCLMHAGGRADQKLIDAEYAFRTCSTTAALGTKEVPEYQPAALGSPVFLSLRGVVGLSDIVLRLLLTLDVELMQSESAEDEFIKGWRNTFGAQRFQLPADRSGARNYRLLKFAKKMRLPVPADLIELEKFLRKHKFVSL